MDLNFFNKMFPSRTRTKNLIDMQLSYENLLTLSEQLYQKEVIFNKFLPYSDKIDDEADRLLEAIKANLGNCVMQRNIYPASLYWTEMLTKYLMLYGLRFTKSEHISFIKLMNELVTIPNLDVCLVNSFAKVLIYLLKKKELISPDELELPWRPLYEICNKYLLNNSKEYSYFSRCPEEYGETLKNLVFFAKTYFPVSATSEIMNELKPKICPFDKKNINVVMKLISWFLPVEVPTKYYEVSHSIWLADLLQIWESCNNAPEWESDLMLLLSHLAANNIGTIEWNSHIPLMFTRFLRAFNVPVFYKSAAYKNKCKLDMIDVARWTASVIGHHKESSVHLAALLKAIAPFLFPTPIGESAKQIKKFIFFTIHFFVLRLRKERHGVETWQEDTVQEFKLTEADIDEFVELMLHPILNSLNSRLSFFETQMSLKYLALLRPNVVIPKVLEIFYPDVGQQIEKYKLFTGTCSLESVSRPLVMGSRHFYPEYGFQNGQAVVIPLLFSTLEAIDLNEGLACWSAVSMLIHLLSRITLIDSSKGSLPDDELERQICQDTAHFEDFVLLFLDKLFSLIEASSVESTRLEYQSQSSLKSTVESMVEDNLFNVTTILLRQCSQSIFASALNKLTTYVLQNSLESRVAGNLLAIICRVFAQTNGQQVLSSMLPKLLQKLNELLGDGQEILPDDEPTVELTHILLVLQATLTTQGNHLLPHMSSIIQLLDRLVKFKSCEGQRLANQLLANVLASFCTVQCVKLEQNLEDLEHPYWNHWAESVDFASAQIRWYTPGKLEHQAAQQIFTRYLEPSVQFIQTCLESRNLFSRDELRSSLRIILKLLEGCDSALPMWSGESITKPYISEFYFEPTLGNEYEIKMPNGENVRLFMVKKMSALQELILEIGEDDTTSLELLQEIWKLLANDKSTDNNNLNLVKSLYKSMKITAENPMVGDKGYLPEVLLERMTILQIFRKIYATYTFTEASKEIMLNLFKLATSKYLKIRLLAQETLVNFLDEYPSAHRTLLPHILEILGKDTDVHKSAFKGALYVIHSSKNHSFLRQNDWYILSSLLPAIVRCKPTENLTIIRQLENIVEYSQKSIMPINICLEVPDTCTVAASQLWLHGLKPLSNPATEDEINRGIEGLRKVGENNRNQLNAVLDKLIHAAQDNHLHWRHRRLAVRFILALLHPENNLPTKTVNYFMKSLISDSIDDRKSAITVMMYVLKLMKRKPLKQLERITERTKDCMPGLRPDNESALYGKDLNYLPLNEQLWEKTRFLDKPCVGYFGWPEKYAFYAPPSQQPLQDKKNYVFTEQERVIEGFFNDSVNLKKLVGFLSLEENKGNDKFSVERYHLFKGLFRQFNNAQLNACLGHVMSLVQEKDESKQRCAAEILCGLLCGSKHWPFSAIDAMWVGLHPIFKKILQNVTEETVDNWRMCVKEIFRKHDPRRLCWLLEFLAEESFSSQSQSSFHDSARLMLLTSAIDTGHRWRLAGLFNRLVPKIEKRLFNEPYDNVRSCLVTLLIVIFDSEITYRDCHNEGDTKHRKIDAFVEKAMQQLESLMNPEEALSVERRKALSAICQWTVAYESSMHCGLFSSMYRLYPVLSHMEHSEANPELADECRRAVAALAQMFVLPRHVPAALNTFEASSKLPSSLMRASAAQFFLTFFSRNMPLLVACDSWINKLRDITLFLMEDQRHEVRERASHLLNMMLLCGVFHDATNCLEHFRGLAKTKLRRKINNLKNENVNDVNDALRLRHAGILGLCAFIQAHPHDVPKFVPPIFEVLSVHLDDPHPIPATIRQTMSEFRRTHCDAWTGLQGVAKYFTEEQFSILQNLTVPPTHYA